MQNKAYPDDDGRVVCDMNVEGMPWYDRNVRREKRAAREAAVAADPRGEVMTNSETRRYIYYAVLACLAVAGVFAVVWFLLTLFMTKVWFA